MSNNPDEKLFTGAEIKQIAEDAAQWVSDNNMNFSREDRIHALFGAVIVMGIVEKRLGYEVFLNL